MIEALSMRIIRSLIFTSLIFCFCMNCDKQKGHLTIETTFYENGQLNRHIYRNLNISDTLLDYREYHENGHLSKSGMINEQGFREKKWSYFNDDFELIAEGNYLHGQKIDDWIYRDTVISWSIYEDEIFSINKPIDWNKVYHQEEGIISFFNAQDEFTSDANFNIQMLSEQKGFTELVEESANTIKRMFNKSEIIAINEVEINGLQGAIIIFNLTIQKKDIYARQALINNNDIVASINYFSTSKNTSVPNEIIFSFQFKN